MTSCEVIWTTKEDQILLNLIEIDSRKNWKKISSLLNNKTPLQCFYRFRKINPEIKKSKWTKEEDILIISLQEKYGNSWSLFSKTLKNRTPKQIRDRFINNLDPNVQRGNFSVDEDLKILELRNLYGNKWSKISEHFENRTSDIIKTRYYSSVRNKVKLLYFLKSLDKDENCKSSNEKNIKVEEEKSKYHNSLSTNGNEKNLLKEKSNFEKSTTFDLIKNQNNIEKFEKDQNGCDSDSLFENELNYFY